MDMNDIAQLAGVSRSTVSRYFNNGYVSQEKRQAIEAVVKKTGYAPSQNAQTLRTGKTHVVGVIIPKINSGSVSRMVAGITNVLNQANYQVILSNTQNDARAELKSMRLLTNKNQVDGIILIATIITPEHRELMENLSVPIVVLDQEVEALHCVYQDDYRAVYDQSLKVLDHAQHPAFIGVTQDDISAGKQRTQGFLDAAEKKGFDPASIPLYQAAFTLDSGYEACEVLLDNHPEVDTIVCATDQIALGALTCLKEFGRAVPADVQVTGVGDGEMAQVVTPTLSTIHHHYKTSGEVAASMLVDLMAAEKPRTRMVKMDFDLIWRGSTRS